MNHNQNHANFPEIVSQYGNWPDYEYDAKSEAEPSEEAQAAIAERAKAIRLMHLAVDKTPEDDPWQPPVIPQEFVLEAFKAFGNGSGG